MTFAELIFAGVQIRTSQKKLMLFHVCNQNPFTLIFRYHYSIEELGGKEEAGAAQNPYRNPARNAAPAGLLTPYVALRFWWP